MRYSKGDGVNTSLSRISYCTHSYSCRVLHYVFGNLPRDDHVLLETIIIKIMCVNQIYLQG